MTSSAGVSDPGEPPPTTARARSTGRTGSPRSIGPTEATGSSGSIGSTGASTSERGARDRWVDRILLAAGVVLLGALSVWRLGHKQLWVDEGVAVGLARGSFSRFVFVITHWEVNQAPFYVLFAAWHRLGDDPATMRALSALFAVATVPIVYLLGRRLYDRRSGALAALLFAANGLVLQWSQEIRGYTMALFLVTLATLLLVRLVDEPSTVRALVYAVVAVLAVATHFFSGLVIAAHALSLLTMRPRPTRALAVAGATVGVLCLPFVLFVVTANGDPLSWVPDSTPTSTARLFARLTGGSFALIASGVVGLVGLVAIGRSVRSDLRSTDAWRRLLPVFWLGVPLLASVGFSLVAKPIAVPRFLIVVVPAIPLIVAVGLVHIPMRWLRGVALVAVLAASFYGASGWYTSSVREDWTGATAAVLADLRPGDTVVVEPRTGNAVANYYADRLGGRELPIVSPDPDGGAIGDRLWEMRRGNQVRGWLADIGLEDWRDRNYVLVDTQPFDGVTVRLYERRPESP